MKEGVKQAADIAQAVVEKVRKLPPDKQQEVLDFVEFLHERVTRSPSSWRNVRGILAGRGIDITEEDIAEIRREMWANFPREIEL